MPKISLFALVTLILFQTQALSAELDRIGSIDGATSVQVKKGTSTRRAKSGDTVEAGETVTTDSKTTATVRSPDGTVLVLGHNSALTIDKDPNALRAATVESGMVRAIVSKANKQSAGSEKFRYFLKTSSATMGVRGTDFVVACDQSSSTMDLHTLEGLVEVAKDVPTMISQGGVKVAGGQEVTADPKGISEAKEFDQRLFAEQLSRSQPGLAIPVPKAKPSPTQKAPGWTKRSNYIKGDQVYFVGVASNVADVTEGRNKALEAVTQEVRDYTNSADVSSIPLQTHMTYEEKTGNTFKVFLLVSAPLKDVKKASKE